MKRILTLGLAGLLLLSLLVRADAELIAQQSVEIKSSPKAVWALIRDFNGLHKWHPGFKNDVIKSGRNNTKGAMRTLTLASGESFDEELLKFDDGKMFFRYRIVGDSPFPITHYVSTLHVQKGKAGSSRVIWQGKFNNKREAGKSDAEVIEMLNDAYKAGLDNLKTLAEKR
jgi:mxaD protein